MTDAVRIVDLAFIADERAAEVNGDACEPASSVVRHSRRRQSGHDAAHICRQVGWVA
jgi:hypothetical protein